MAEAAVIKAPAPLMVDSQPKIEPFGPTTRKRRLAAAVLMMASAVPVALVAATLGRPPRLHLVLVAIGVAALAAWAVDGQRYVGAGIASLSLGVALWLMETTAVDPFALMFGFLGAALVFVSRVNPHAVSGSAGLLIYVAANALGLHSPDAMLLPRPLVFALIMLAWGGANLRRVLSGCGPAAAPASSSTRSGSGQGRIFHPTP